LKRVAWQCRNAASLLLDAAGYFRQDAGMDSDEREVFQYLKTWGADFVNAKEVSRRAGTRKRYHEDPDWAKPVLMGMADRGIVEGDALGRFRIKPTHKKGGAGRWVSPEIEKALKEKGLEVETNESGTGLAADDYYEQL
jgi:hypothetical protein